MTKKPGDTFSGIGYATSATGALVAADSTPTGTLYRNGLADGAVAVTVTTPSTGKYRLTCTIPTTYAAGDDIDLEMALAVSAVADATIVKSAGIDLYRESDLSVADVVQASPAPTTTAFAGSNALSATNTAYNNAELVFVSGANKGQAHRAAYVGATRIFTLASALPVAPVAGDQFILIGRIE